MEKIFPGTSYMKPFVMVAWTFLTIGITLGSLWAYYELGWGGWWFWDPVENASFMPWLIGDSITTLSNYSRKKTIPSSLGSAFINTSFFIKCCWNIPW